MSEKGSEPDIEARRFNVAEVPHADIRLPEILLNGWAFSLIVTELHLARTRVSLTRLLTLKSLTAQNLSFSVTRGSGVDLGARERVTGPLQCYSKRPSLEAHLCLIHQTEVISLMRSISWI